MKIRPTTLIATLIGIAMLVFVVSQVDSTALLAVLRRISLFGFLLVMAIYPVAALFDALVWMLYLPAKANSFASAMRLWRAQLVGDAMQSFTPFGMAASETVKALLLHRRYGISLSDATASLALVQIILALAQVPFLVIGLWLLGRAPGLHASWYMAFVIAIIVIALFMLLLLLAVHQRWLRRLPIMRDASSDDPRRARLVAGLDNVEQQLSQLLLDQRKFLLSLALALANWIAFAIEIWIMAWALGRPISFADAWAIEAVIALANAVAFFIPGRLGAQDGATAFAFKVFYADPALGVAVALLRRIRELFWALAALPLNVDALSRKA